jgi:hypothetical protein
MVGYAVDIACPVDKDGKDQHRHDEKANWPAED